VLLKQLLLDVISRSGRLEVSYTVAAAAAALCFLMCILQHRLRNCGLSNAIYLVEDYGSMENFKLPEDTLNQAIINTQVLIIVALMSMFNCFLLSCDNCQVSLI